MVWDLGRLLQHIATLDPKPRQAQIESWDRAPVTECRVAELGRREALLARMRTVARDVTGDQPVRRVPTGVPP